MSNVQQDGNESREQLTLLERLTFDASCQLTAPHPSSLSGLPAVPHAQTRQLRDDLTVASDPGESLPQLPSLAGLSTGVNPASLVVGTPDRR